MVPQNRIEFAFFKRNGLIVGFNVGGTETF
jgi:hypothetical protein